MFNLGIFKEYKKLMYAIIAIAVAVIAISIYMTSSNIIDAFKTDANEHNVRVAAEATKELKNVIDINDDLNKDIDNLIVEKDLSINLINITNDEKIDNIKEAYDRKEAVDDAAKEAIIESKVVNSTLTDKPKEVNTETVVNKDTNTVVKTITKVIKVPMKKTPKEKVFDTILVINIHKAYKKALR